MTDDGHDGERDSQNQENSSDFRQPQGPPRSAMQSNDAAAS
jgi:hypothetical protein